MKLKKEEEEGGREREREGREGGSNCGCWLGIVMIYEVVSVLGQMVPRRNEEVTLQIGRCGLKHLGG